ncbi:MULTISPECIES: DUF932 domain-containing protein [Pseudonocardia]|uniref:DUF932 domain-containing protein n=2 Tax=Pseudonocardia TaxID=1847 RepID=A0A1Y2MHA5_PSEAH|nr:MULTISPECIES: DUF932 domain-containing protein [Pseudonocardia]OSY34665.1 hypothetical protein BG845_06639 [Pseudonocardia autotrophica]TDN76438.1 hypothetical protein C8E95_5644 [Pseudonocardia autotrophica]BBG00434.1 hypothetical protein Pdca_16430 [Pseudonocardia autotrophica]GEC29291.1 hypothetical protein PSA01_63200 [Pseudonocardia saturnea]
MPGTILTTRNATVADLVAVLQAQHAAKLDVVTPACHLVADNGHLRLIGVGEPQLTPDGVTVGETVLRPTAVADAGIAEKLGIPLPYLRRLRAEQLGLYDANVNTWLADDPDRRFLVRGLHNPDGGTGIARALLSDSYRMVDNLDVLMAVLEGVRAAGVPVDIAGCDLTERRMYVRVRAPGIGEYAPELLGDYRSPFTGARGADNPLVFAGFVVSNSETGHGSFALTPQLTVQVCDNGMTITRDALREVHLGGRLADGVVRWSSDTQDALLGLVVKQARDAVTTFLDREYVRAKLAEIARQAGVPIRDPQATLEHVGKALRFTAEQQATILAHFVQGGDVTSGGVLHAVTSAAQTLEDADAAHDLERAGLRAMALAAAHAA